MLVEAEEEESTTFHAHICSRFQQTTSGGVSTTSVTDISSLGESTVSGRVQ